VEKGKGWVGFAIAAAMVIATNVSGYAAFRPVLEGHWYFPLIAAIPLFALTPVALLRAHREDGDGAAYLPKSGDVALGFAVAVVLYGVLFATTRLLLPLGTPQSGWMLQLYKHWGDPAALRGRVVAISAMTLVCVYADEVVWRDYLRRLLEPQLGTRATFWTSVALYGLAHVGAGIASARPGSLFNPVLPVASFALAIAWQSLVRFTGRVSPGAFSHTLVVLTAVLFFRLYGI